MKRYTIEELQNMRESEDHVEWLKGKCPWMETYPPSQIS